MVRTRTRPHRTALWGRRTPPPPPRPSRVRRCYHARIPRKRGDFLLSIPPVRTPAPCPPAPALSTVSSKTQLPESPPASTPIVLKGDGGRRGVPLCQHPPPPHPETLIFRPVVSLPHLAKPYATDSRCVRRMRQA